MDPGDVAFAPPGGDQAPSRADPEGLRCEPALAEKAEQEIKPDAVRADRDEVGRLGPESDRDDLDRLARLDEFARPGDRDESVGPARRS